MADSSEKASAGLFELHGYTQRVFYKNNDHLTFSFFDPELGSLVCIARKDECPLYYGLDRNKKYHLLAKLRGRTKIGEDGNQVVFNNLYIKKVLNRDEINNE